VPKTYGINDRDRAARWVMERLFDGRLRSGARLDRNVIASELGISRVPVQEMLVQLEHDGIVRTEYHRGAFIERFDASVVEETYELFGLLNGLVSAKAASLGSAELVAGLADLVKQMRSAIDIEQFDSCAWEFRRLLNRAVGGPRMRALLMSFRGFMPVAFRVTLEAAQPKILRSYAREYDAIKRGDAAGADAAARGRAQLEGQLIVTELERRDVFSPRRTSVGRAAHKL
jgi:DNA-binding GntR family transcriptional regulator